MDTVKVFVDGACRNNGHNNPQGGCGTFWGPLHPLNVSEKLRGEKQTNNRAELSAAIIAVTQGIELGFSNLEINTDSKYVKEGITKWIKDWKLKEWKTAKNKGDVLNKDLWVTLDCLEGKLEVDWKWVEGHQDVEGNLQADSLAKKGISAESWIWQDIAFNKFEKTWGDTLEKTQNNSTPRNSIAGDSADQPQFICKKCQGVYVEGENCIQCQECRFWFHYKCSELPPYQLYLYGCTQRKFTCEFCADVDEDFVNSCGIQTRTEVSVKPTGEQIPSVKTQTETLITTDAETMTTTIRWDEKSTSTTETCFRNLSALTSTSCQTEGFPDIYGLESFKQSTVALLQESFVGAFDKINGSIREMKINQTEENEMKQRILSLTKENERLRVSNSEDVRNTQKTKSCTSCTEISSRMGKINKDMEKERERSQNNLHTTTTENEIKVSKLQTENTILRHKLELSSKQLSIQESDMSMMEKRLESKNNLIVSLEEQQYKMSQKISELQDEVMAWKLHECRSDHKEVFNQVSKKGPTKENRQKDGQSLINTNHDTAKESELNKSFADAEKEQNQGTTPVHNDVQRHDTRPENKIEKHVIPAKETEKKVLIVGTSNIKFLSPAYIGESEFSVTKMTKYTLDETYQYFKEQQPTEHHDAFILHSLCNDLDRKTPEECTDYLTDIVEVITQKHNDAKVIVSLGLPRADVKTNRNIEKTNVLIKEKLPGKKNVYICDNSNLFYRGDAQKGVLNEDGLHLSRTGTRKLGKNLKEALWDIFDIPVVLYESRNEHEAQYHQPTGKGYGSSSSRSNNNRRDVSYRYGTGSDNSYRHNNRRDYSYKDYNRRDNFYRDNIRREDSYRQNNIRDEVYRDNYRGRWDENRSRSNERLLNGNKYSREFNDSYSTGRYKY